MIGLRPAYFIREFIFALVAYSIALLFVYGLLYKLLPYYLPTELTSLRVYLFRTHQFIADQQIYLWGFVAASVALYPYARLAFEIMLKQVTRGITVVMPYQRVIKFRAMGALLCLSASVLLAPFGFLYLMTSKHIRSSERSQQ